MAYNRIVTVDPVNFEPFIEILIVDQLIDINDRSKLGELRQQMKNLVAQRERVTNSIMPSQAEVFISIIE